MLFLNAAAGQNSPEGRTVLPSGLRRVNEEAFLNDESIKSVYANEGLLEIGARAFKGSGLTEIYLPDSLVLIENSAFEGLTDVTAIVKSGSYAHEFCEKMGIGVRILDASLPAAPVLKGFSTNERNIHLHLDGVLSAEGYHIYIARKSDFSDAHLFSERSLPGDMCITYSGFAKGETYYFAVCAYVKDESGNVIEGKMSNVLSVTPERILPPAFAEAAYHSPNQAEISWQKVHNAHGYIIYRSDRADFSENVSIFYIENGVDGCTYIDSGLDMDATYYYRIGAFAGWKGHVKYYSDLGGLESARKYVHTKPPEAVYLAHADESGNTDAYDNDNALFGYVGDRFTLEIRDMSNDEIVADYYLFSDDPQAVEAYTGEDGKAHVAIHKNRSVKLFVSNVYGEALEDIPEERRRLVCRVNTPVYRALVIGNDYIGHFFESEYLEVCADDRAAVGEMLSSMTGTNYIVSVQGNLTAAGFESAIASVFAEQTENDVSLVYYSGHGAADGSLLGVDRKLFTVADMKNALDRIPGRKIVILDSCFSGSFIGKSVDDPVSKARAINGRIISVFASKAKNNLASDQYYVITAASMDEYSYTGRTLSLFTYPVCYGSGWRDADGVMNADADGNGKITLDECHRYAYAYALNASSRYKQHAQVYPEDCSFVIWAK